MERPGLTTTSILEERQVDGVILLTVQRTLKGEGEATLKERLEALTRAGHLQILIDLQHMPYIDSTELGRLIRAHLSVRQAGGRVRLCNISEKVMTLMKLTRLDTVLELYATEAEAVASVRSHAAKDPSPRS